MKIRLHYKDGTAVEIEDARKMATDDLLRDHRRNTTFRYNGANGGYAEYVEADVYDVVSLLDKAAELPPVAPAANNRFMALVGAMWANGEDGADLAGEMATALLWTIREGYGPNVDVMAEIDRLLRGGR